MIYKAFLYTLTAVWAVILSWHVVRFWRLRAGGWLGMDGRPIRRAEQPKAYWLGIGVRLVELAFETAVAIFLVIETVTSLNAG